MYPLKFILATAILLCATTVSALPSDRNQPINIEADRAVRDDKNGTMVYNGNVIIRQGTILIRAAEVTVHSTNSKANRVVCIGTPAHYQQKPDGDKGLVLASANTIEYMLDSDQIHLIDNASLEQDGNTTTADKIDYDIAREVIKAKGDTTGKQRIIMVIPPQNHGGDKKSGQAEKSTSGSDKGGN